MKKSILLSSIAILPFIADISFAADTSSLFGPAPQEQQIIVNNRILAKVNGKAISVVDLMKKMDLLFYKQYPQYTSSTAARFQFYQLFWKQTLDEMIDKDLILLDSQDGKLNVSAGDVRQEMESLFGPNIIENLDKVGLSFADASQMVQDDIAIKRMLYFRVHGPIIAKVTPIVVLNYYNEVAKDNIRDNLWVFNVITIRHRDPAKAAEQANIVYNLLTEDKIPLNELTAKLESSTAPSLSQVKVNVSEEIKTNEKELSDAFKTNLVKLAPNSYSLPVLQKSRADNGALVRIFYLKEMTPGGEIPYNEMEDKIKAKLIDEGIAQETEIYLNKLRRRFDVQTTSPKELEESGFQPFILK